MTLLYWSVEWIGSFLEAYASFFFCSFFIEKEKESKHIATQKILFSILLSTIIILLNMVELVSIATTIIVFILMCTLQILLYHGNILKTIVVMILYFAFMFAIDMFCFEGIVLLTGKQMDELIDKFSPPRMASVISANVILFILSYLLSRFSKVRIKKSSGKSILILSIFTLFLMAISTVMYVTQIRQNQESNQFFMFLFFTVMVVMIIIIYVFVVKMIESSQHQNENNLLHQQNEMILKNIYEQKRRFELWEHNIHDYKHKTNLLYSLSKDKKYDEIDKIIEKDYHFIQDKAFYIHSGNALVDVILNNKMNIAKEKNINFTCNIDLSQKKVMEDEDLCILLGNLLDNAIEASESESNPLIHIQMTTIQNTFTIKIINRYTSQKFSLITKKENQHLHGVGLNSVKSIVERYDGSFSLEQKDDLVTALVTIFI